MAYAVKYILQFTSDRGNEIRIEVLKKDYQGEVIYKSLGGSPSLSIEQGDGAIKGSSLVFAMQADIEGELQELYTTDNKQFKVNMYRNEVLSWQGYILPELYSEEYVDAPYDVSVTATDQLATLKAITYQREDVNVSLSTIIEDILSFTQISVPVTYHQNLSALRKGEVPMLVDSHISQAAYNGYSCYDVLNNILLSCNCCIMQINGEWLISSLTNSTTNYYTAGVSQVREHKALGQLGVGEVCPAGTLTMVNNPALKGAKVEYAHMLRNSFLVNADCVDREGWNYTPDSRNPIDIPGEREAFGKIFKTYCWELHPVNIREDNSLQLWQEVALEKDERNYYDLSVKTLFSTDAKLLLMAVTYLGSDGVERRLTSEGWIEKWDKSDVNYYIQITGTNKNAGLDAIADIEQYEMSTVQFVLPPVDGTMRIGFINSTTDYKDPLGAAPIYVSQVYLTVSGVTGQECTTEVEPNATQEQQGVLLAYGDTFESENAYKLGLNTLKKSSGENITSWWLDNENFSSYYDTMLQEFSRYFGVKKAQLQGIIMGKDVLSDMYADVFSGRVMRLLTAQVDLLADEASVTVEEVITTTVDFDTVIYATNNTNSFGSSSGGGAGTSGGASSTAGESLLGVQSDGDVYVKDGRALVGQEGRFENLALPVNAPAKRNEARTYIYSSDPSKGAIDIAKIAKWIDEQAEMWVLDAENGVIKTIYNVVSEQEIISCRRASGSGSGGGGGITEITAQMITDALGYVPYSSLNPAGYITSAAIPNALKNPYALTINGRTYDGSEAVNITISGGGGVADSVDWVNVYNKPTTLSGYGITDALSTSGGTITGDLSLNQYLRIKAWSGYGSGSCDMWYNGNNGILSITAQNITNYFGETFIHSGNYSSYALPLSGGTITGEHGALDIKRNNEWASGIKFSNTKGTLGYIGVNDDGQPRFWFSDQIDYGVLLHTKNIDDISVNNPVNKPAISVTNTHSNAYSTTFLWGYNYITPNLIQGQHALGIMVGYETDTNNMAHFGYRHYADGNGNNAATIGLYGADDLVVIQASGDVLIGKGSSVSVGYKLDVGGSIRASAEITNDTSMSTWAAYQLRFNGGTCGLYADNWISGGNANRLWLYNAHLLALYGSSIELHSNAWIAGNTQIGANTDNGARLQVEGASSTYEVATFKGPYHSGLAIKAGEGYNPFIRFGTHSTYKAEVGFTTELGNIYIGPYNTASGIVNINVDTASVFIGSTTNHSNNPKFYLKGASGDSKPLFLAESDTDTAWNYGATILNPSMSAGNRIAISVGKAYGRYNMGLLYYTHDGWSYTSNRISIGMYGANDVLNVVGTSRVGINKVNPQCALDVVGDIIATGEVISSRRATSSDARLKDNINHLIAEDCLAIVRNLQPSSWNWKENGEYSLGFIAQDIEPLMPYAVTRIKDDVLGQRLNLQYDQFFAPVVGAIQCLDIKVNGHEDEIESLKNEVAELKQKLSKYETVWQ